MAEHFDRRAAAALGRRWQYGQQEWQDMGKFVEGLSQLTIGPVNVAVGPENGPPLVFLHGVTRRWQCLLPIIEPLSARWQVYALDFPAHGGSQAQCDDYTVTSYGDATEQWLHSRFNEPVVIYGHSLGAMVAADVAGRVRSNVVAAILEDPPFQTMGNRIATTPLLSYFQGLRAFAGTPPKSLADAVAGLARLPLVDPRTGATTRLGESRSPAALRFMATCLARLSPAVLEPIIAGQWLRDYSLTNVSRRLTLPVLLLQADGEQGGMLTDEEAKIVCDLGQDVTLVKRRGVGHLMHWTEPDWLTRELTLFLESLPVRQKWVD